jgi:hypothetical protein
MGPKIFGDVTVLRKIYRDVYQAESAAKFKKEKIMTIRYSKAVLGTTVALAVATVAAQDLRIVKFKGLINDYSPSTVAGGPYEIRGEWSVDVQRTGIADFTADLNMETSDYGISSATAVDPANPATRGAHTHHISMTNAAVTYDTSACPVFSPPTSGPGVVLNGTAVTTGNGGPATFESKGPSTVQVCITGGTEANFSNMTMVYTGPATGHFGPQAIHGVVTLVSAK